MMRLFITLVVFCSMLSGARAADIIAPTAYDWSGAYLGVLAGTGWGSTHPTFGIETATVNLNGVTGGVDAGYDWQSGAIVYGVMLDGSWAGLHGSEVGPNRPCIIAGLGCTANVNWLATGRARIGLASGRVLPYLTGGLAAGGGDERERQRAGRAAGPAGG